MPDDGHFQIFYCANCFAAYPLNSVWCGNCGRKGDKETIIDERTMVLRSGAVKAPVKPVTPVPAIRPPISSPHPAPVVPVATAAPARKPLTSYWPLLLLVPVAAIVASVLFSMTRERPARQELNTTLLFHKNVQQVDAVFGAAVEEKDYEECGYNRVYRFRDMTINARFNRYDDGSTECLSADIDIDKATTKSWRQAVQKIGLDPGVSKPERFFAEEQRADWTGVPVNGEPLRVWTDDLGAETPTIKVSASTRYWDEWHEKKCNPATFSQYQPDF